MREQPTPCVNTTRAQFLRGLHRTFNDDRVCDSCRGIAARATALARGEGGDVAHMASSPTSADDLLVSARGDGAG